MRTWLLLLAGLVVGCTRGEPVAPQAQPPRLQQPATSAAPVVTAAPLEPGFSSIAFSDMAVFPSDGTADQTWSLETDEILCTGKPKCYLHTKMSFGDGTLLFDYRFEPDAKVTDPMKLAAHNTGVLLFIQEPHAIWPKSIEVQGKHSEMGQLRPNGSKAEVEQLKVVYEDHPEVRESARRPVGEWNSIEIVTKQGAITASINGQVVAVGQPGELKSGLIGLQAEGHRLRYRRLRFAPAP